jgi:hypothetical protein
MPTFTSGPNAATPPGYGSDPSTLVPSHANENIDPDNDNSARRTPLPSPCKHPTPATPQPSDRPSSLRRRYLEEVAMSPVTPPRTPSPTKGHMSPSKRTGSPTKGRDSPTKQKLEIGQNGFYFTCELPMSKITPKKSETGRMTPTTRTPSPTKTGSARKEATSRSSSPVKQTTSKALRQSPLKKETPKKAPKETSTAIASSATKNGLPSMSVVANPLSHTPAQDATTSKPPKQTDNVKVTPAKVVERNTRVMQGASTPSSAPATVSAGAQDIMKGEATNDDRLAPATPQPIRSPRPLLNATGQTPNKAARGASFDIGDLMAGLKSHTLRPRAATAEQVGDTNLFGSPTPLQKAAEKFQVPLYVPKQDARPVTPAKSMTDTSPLIAAVDAPPISRIPIPFKIKEQTMQYRSQSFPSPTSKPESRSENTPGPWKKRVKFHDSEPSTPKLSKPVFQKTPRPAGTNLTVLRAMQQEMDTLQSSLSNSLGVNFKFSGRENTFELPAMANSLLESDCQATPSRTKPQHLRTGSATSLTSNSTKFSISTVRASMLMHPNMPVEQPSASMSTVLKSPHVGKTAQKTRLERLATPKQTIVAERQLKASKTPTKLTSTSGTATLTRSAKITAGKTSTPHSKSVTTNITNTPSRPRPTPKPTPSESKPSATAAKLKPTGGSIPQGPRKSVFDAPTPQKSTSTPKPLPSTLRPTATPNKIPRPVFASATDIADRIAAWNSQDRIRTTTRLPKTKPASTAITPSKPPTKPAKQSSPAKSVKQSFTPEGSPTRPAVVPKSLVPKRAAPKPPATPCVAALTRLKGMGLPRTPVRVGVTGSGRNRVGGEMDANAFRTPSKEIQGSLDRAIDRKIEEDRMGGIGAVGVRV